LTIDVYYCQFLTLHSSTIPTPEAHVSRSTPSKPIAIHARYFCDTYQGLEKIINSSTSVEKAFKGAFPDLPYTSTVYRYLKVFKKAKALSLADKFINYGHTEKATWTSIAEGMLSLFYSDFILTCIFSRNS